MLMISAIGSDDGVLSAVSVTDSSLPGLTRASPARPSRVTMVVVSGGSPVAESRTTNASAN